MKSLALLASTALLFAACAITVPATDDTHGRDNRKPGTAQVGFAAIVVNGRTLTGPNSSAQTRDTQLLIPVATLARALGDTVQIDPAGRFLSVLRQTGVTAAYDSHLGQVTENGALALTVANHRSIVLSPLIEEVMLPSEIVSALFEASIRFDRQKNVVLVTCGVVGLVTQQKGKRSFGEIYQAEYEYNFNRYSSSNSQSLTLNAVGRLADGRFSFVSNSSGSLGKLSPRNFSFNLDRPNGQHFVAGDLGTGSGLQLLTSNIRGALASIPVGNFTIAAFGGRSNSGTTTRGGFVEDDFTIPQPRSSRDTNVFGITATTKPFDSGVLKPLIFAAGAMRFSGGARQGNVVSTSVNFGGRRAQLQADFGVGTFNGRLMDDRAINGSGMAVDVAGSYQVANNLSFQGRFAHIGSNFLAPQSGIREPVDLRAGGASWSPVKWLTASMTASTTRRPNETGRAESFVSTSFAISPGGTGPQIYFSHTQSSSKNYRSGEFTIINFSKNFHRVRVFANTTRVKNIGPASVNTQIGANFLINDRNTLEVNQGLASHGSLNGLAEWRTDRLFNRLNFAAGLGYNYSQNGALTTFEKFTGTLNLPRDTSLQISYLQNTGGPTLLVRVRGTLFRKHNAAAYLNSEQSEVNDFSRLSGRVYQDIDGNGKYDPGVDKSQTGVKVRVDGNRYVETDVNGLFAFEAIQSGEHKVYVDLLSVRADLTLLDTGSHELVLDAGKGTQLDFRLARTGRITGRVWLDLNGNGKFDEGETPLADIRVVTSSGRDTLTDTDGRFVIGDLAPGEHVILLDEKTLPQKTQSGFRPAALQVYPGRETGDADLPVIAIPAEVKHFGSKP